MRDAFTPCARHLEREWGCWVALRVVLAILFGLTVIVWPLGSITALALFWGAFALADGALALGTAWRGYKVGECWWPYLIFGFIGISVGVITFVMPPAVTTLVHAIAFWALFGGITQVAVAIGLRKSMEDELFLVIAGAINMLFGLLLFFYPLSEGVSTLAWIIGFCAMVSALFYLLLAFSRKPRKTV